MTGLLVKDKWTAADGTAWNPAIWTTVRNVRGSSPPPTTTANTGRMVTASGAECHILAALGPDLADQDVTFQWRAVTYGGAGAPNPGVYPYVAYRVATNVGSGDLPRDGYALFLLPLRQRVNLIKTYTVGGTGSTSEVLATADLVAIDDTLPHWFRIHVKGSRHQVKWWHTDGGEPPTWNMDVTDVTFTSGRTYLATLNDDTQAAVEVEWDTFRLEELLPAEPGIIMPQGATVAVNVGAVPVTACYIGAAGVPVPG